MEVIMQDLCISRKQRVRVAICFGAILPVMVLWFLAGCASDVKIKPSAAFKENADSNDFSAERLQDGREGFIITETAQLKLDETIHRDFDRAVEMMNLEEYDKAIELLDKVLSQSPGVSAPYINMAIACRKVGKLEQAEEYIKTALQMVPGHPAASNEYGLLYRRTGRFAEARTIYEKTLSNYPEYYPVHRNLGILCDLYLNDLSCALEHYEIYSKAMPEDQQVKLWIADLHVRLDQ